MRLFVLIVAWLSWSVLLYGTLTGPVLFLFSDPPKAGSEGGEDALLWSAYFSGVIAIALLICSRRFFDGKPAGELLTWPPALAFLFCRIVGLSLLTGAILCASLSANKEAPLKGWIGVIVGLMVLNYTARNPKGLPTQASS